MDRIILININAQYTLVIVIIFCTSVSQIHIITKASKCTSATLYYENQGVDSWTHH